MIEVFQYVKPFAGPLFRSITPSARPFGLPPRVPKHYKSLTLTFFDTQDGVSMASIKTINFRVGNHFMFATCIKTIEWTAEKTVSSRVQKFFFPEPVLVENVLRRYQTIR